jgi:hypothetical protein
MHIIAKLARLAQILPSLTAHTVSFDFEHFLIPFPSAMWPWKGF